MRVSIDQIDPAGLQGNTGGAWFIGTGISTVSPDGSIAQQFMSPYDTEPVWLTLVSSPTIIIPPPALGYETLNPPITYQTPAPPVIVVVADPTVVSAPEPAYGLMMLFVFFALFWMHKARTNGKGYGALQAVDPRYAQKRPEAFDFD